LELRFVSHHDDHIGRQEANDGNGLGSLSCGERRVIIWAENHVRIRFG
jgi:hypothetical protein